MQWCSPLTWHPEQPGGVGSIPSRARPLERSDEGSWTRLALSYFCISALGAKNLNVTFTFAGTSQTPWLSQEAVVLVVQIDLRFP